MGVNWRYAATVFFDVLVFFEVEAVLAVEAVEVVVGCAFAVPVLAVLLFAGVVFFFGADEVVVVCGSASEAASTADKKSKIPNLMLRKEGRSE